MTAFVSVLTAYWRAPDAAALLARFTAPDSAGDWRPEDVLTVPVFLAHVLDANPERAAPLVESLRGGDAVKVEVTAQALNYCNLPDRARLMERLVGAAAAAAMDPAGADFLALAPSHPVHVDMLWMAFFATGTPAYLDLIVSLLDGWLPETRLQDMVGRAAVEPAVQAPALAGLLAKAAYLTLSAHGRDCPPVAEALTRRAAAADGLSAALAARILAALQS